MFYFSGKASLMTPRQTLSRIQKLCDLYIDRSINLCDSRHSVMYELKDRVCAILEASIYSEIIDNPCKKSNPQLESLVAHLRPSRLYQNGFDHFLIVGGVGRSGTTAFGNVLNKFLGVNSRLFIFTERYNWKLPYSPSSFLHEFIFQEDLRNSSKSIQEKFGKYVHDPKAYEEIRFIGDKRPGASYMLEVNDLFFSHQKKKLLYLHLYRNPTPTALSWEKRALDANDRWPKSWGSEMMAKHYISQSNIALEFATSSRLKSIDTRLVDYDRFFFDETYCGKCFDFITSQLGLPAAKSFLGSEEVDHFISENKDYLERRRALNADYSPCLKSSPMLNKSHEVYRALLANDA